MDPCSTQVRPRFDPGSSQGRSRFDPGSNQAQTTGIRHEPGSNRVGTRFEHKPSSSAGGARVDPGSIQARSRIEPGLSRSDFGSNHPRYRFDPYSNRVQTLLEPVGTSAHQRKPGMDQAHGRGSVRSWLEPGSILERTWSEHGSIAVRAWFEPGSILVHAWFDPGSKQCRSQLELELQRAWS